MHLRRSHRSSVSPLAVCAGAAAGLLLGLVAACGGGDLSRLSSVPAPITRATLAGPLCLGGETHCRCRERGEVVPVTDDPERKRYEIRVGPADNELWVKLGDMVFYKSVERGEECFYVELLPGKYPVSLHARDDHGFKARFTISEQGAKGWYDTFEFDCGTPGDCAMLDLEDWMDALAQHRRGVHDPCGSTKIRKVRYATGRVPDQRHPDALELSLVLDVYRFTPEHGPGDPACAGNF